MFRLRSSWNIWDTNKRKIRHVMVKCRDTFVCFFTSGCVHHFYEAYFICTFEKNGLIPPNLKHSLSDQLHSTGMIIGHKDPRKSWQTVTWLSRSYYNGRGTILIKLSYSMVAYVKGIKYMFPEDYHLTILRELHMKMISFASIAARLQSLLIFCGYQKVIFITIFVGCVMY